MAKGNHPLPRPKFRTVPLNALTTDEEAFQPRSGGLKPNHVALLCDVLRRGTDLDPIAVWEDPATRELIVADGHHRLAAYEQVRPMGKVKVAVYSCDRSTAMAIPVADNTKNRLGLSYDDKANWAWRRTADGIWSKAEIVRRCGVSTGTVATMRKVKKELEAAEADLSCTWRQAQREARGDTDREWSDDAIAAAREAAIARADEAIGGPLTELFQRWPEVAMGLVERCAGSKLNDALDYLGWREMTPAEIEGRCPF